MDKKLVKLISIVFIVLLATQAYSANFSKLAGLVKQKKNKQAYALASKMSAKYAGNAKFDFLYGLAALYSKHPQQASFAFERVLMQQPKNHRARLELALSYFMLKNYKQSRKQFTHVLKIKPPKQVRKNIIYFLKLIKKQAHAKKKSTSRLFLRLGLKTGYDSNINTATSTDAIDIPNLGVILLANTNTETSSAYLQGFLSPGFMVPLSAKLNLFASMSLNSRRNFHISNFDTDTTAFSMGIMYQINKRNQIVIPVLYNRLYLENSDATYRKLFSGAVKVYHIANRTNKFGVFYELNNMVFPTAGLSNSVMNLFGVSWRHVFPKASLIWTNRVYAGRDKSRTTRSNANQNSRWLTGIEERLNYYPKNKIYMPYTRFEYQNSSYAVRHNLIGVRRAGGLIDITAGIRWKLPKGWILDTQYKYTHNAVNSDLFKYVRNMVNIGLEYTFR